MFQSAESSLTSKRELYNRLASQLSSLLASERDLIANAANFSSLIFHSLPGLNWAGFYFAKDGELVRLFVPRLSVPEPEGSGTAVSAMSALKR